MGNPPRQPADRGALSMPSKRLQNYDRQPIMRHRNNPEIIA